MQLYGHLDNSLRRLEVIHRASIILNPVENIPFAEDVLPAAGFLHGLYCTDKVRMPSQERKTILQFAGRKRLSRDCRRVYKCWAKALGAADVSMRLLSGLHAHTVFFMAIARAGQRVLLLPEEAGGHVSTARILMRLGLEVIPMAVDTRRLCVHAKRTLDIASQTNPDFIFVDRSEGLVQERFEWLTSALSVPAIYDASQYLSNVLAGDHVSPFSDGFDYLVASTHKNFPGPQKALLASKVDDDQWRRILAGISVYVSNFHVFSVYAAGKTLMRREFIQKYSADMLAGAVHLESELLRAGLPVVGRPDSAVPTHHIWLRAPDRDTAFDMYRALERVRILTNYRKLPYNLGFGLRLGTSAVARLGITQPELTELARIIAAAIASNGRVALRHDVRMLAESLWMRQPPSPQD